MGRIIGIDLGTTNTVAAYMDGDQPKVVINEEGARLTPSVVGFTKEGERLVGDVAKRQMVIYPQSTVHSVKRFIGRRYSEVVNERDQVTYDVIDRGDDEIGIRVDGEVYTPQELQSLVIQKVVKAAEDFLGEPVEEAVISVPAYFADRQRQATRDSAKIAGLTVSRVINEPTAAALSYIAKQQKAATIAVYDFGGGTFDISILDVEDDVGEVRATAGNNRLGGNDIDQRIVSWLLEQFQQSNDLDVSGDKMVRQRLVDAAEKAKMEISSAYETEIHLPFLTADETGPKHLQTTFTRATFELLCEDLFQTTIDECQKALKESKLSPTEIDEVIMVGGSSRIPKVQKLVSDLFTRPLNKTFNPDEVVAIGAAIQAGMLGGDVDDVTLLDVTSYSLGIEVKGRQFAKLIPKNTTVPAVRSQMVSTVMDRQQTVRVHVLQGEASSSLENVSLGEFELTNIEPAPSGEPRIEVTFTIDSDGIVNVSAQDTTTGSQNSIVIRAPTCMTEDQIEDAGKRLGASGDEGDEAYRELRDRVEKQLFTLEETLREHKLALRKKDIFDVEQALKRGRMAITKGADKESLEELTGYLRRFQGLLMEKAGSEHQKSEVRVLADE